MARRKIKNKREAQDESTLVPPPRSFVMRHGDAGKAVARLVGDVRRVMQPHTAIRLHERPSNKLRDFIAMAGPLHVSHFLIFTSSDAGTNLRIARTPHGPTLGFRVLNYTLTADIVKSQKMPKTQKGTLFQHPPLLVLNNFNSEIKEVKLMATMLQSLYPAIDVQQMKVGETRRVILFNYNAETQAIDFRHYAIDVRPTGLSRGVKAMIGGDLPDLHGYNDVGDYVMRQAMPTESDVEDAGDSTVILPHAYAGRNNRQSEKRAIKLTELGPRMELSLIKVQNGLCAGEVIYHRFVRKSKQDIDQQNLKIKQKQAIKNTRRKDQEANVERKLKLKKDAKAQQQHNSTSDEEKEDSSDDDDDDELEDFEGLDEEADLQMEEGSGNEENSDDDNDSADNVKVEKKNPSVAFNKHKKSRQIA